jgi:hypothetical protein
MKNEKNNRMMQLHHMLMSAKLYAREKSQRASQDARIVFEKEYRRRGQVPPLTPY